MQFVLLGDTTVGQEALLRFYVLHVAVLPAVLVLLIAIHFWRIRKDGGLSRPEEVQPAQARARCVLRSRRQRRCDQTERVYGLQGFVRGPFTKVGNVPDDSVYSWPNLLIAELFVFVLTVSLILVVSLLFNAPLEAAGQRDASAESGEGAVVLPRAAGDGELLGVLGRRRHSRD